LALASLGLDTGHAIVGTDILDPVATVTLSGGSVRLEQQPPQSVRMIKLIDTSVPPAAPGVLAHVPSTARAGETIQLSADTQAGTPALGYHWILGDGTQAEGARVSHCYTRAGEFAIQLVVEGADGLPGREAFSLKVTGALKALPDLRENRRFEEPSQH
jgi:hypothetical protein